MLDVLKEGTDKWTLHSQIYGEQTRPKEEKYIGHVDTQDIKQGATNRIVLYLHHVGMD